jgi:hypothetical protein
MTALAKRKQEMWGELGPCMRALPSNRWRAFVECLLLEPPGHGAQTNAARRAGFGHARTSPLNMAKIASRSMRDDRIVAAIGEECRKLLRGGAPDAVKALQNLVRNPEHRDHVRGIALVLGRTDPEIQQHKIEVEHYVTNEERDIQHYRALKKLGAPAEAFLARFGPNGLARVEALILAEEAKRREIEDTGTTIVAEYEVEAE